MKRSTVQQGHNMKRSTVLDIPSGTKFWYNLADSELERIRAADIATGIWHDAGGEPVLYSRVGSSFTTCSSTISVVRARGVKWDSWSRKPKGLVEVSIRAAAIDSHVLGIMTDCAREWARGCDPIIMISIH